MFHNSNQAIFEPNYITLLLIFLGIVYLIYFALTILKFKLDALTISTLAISFLSILGMQVSGYHYSLQKISALQQFEMCQSGIPCANKKPTIFYFFRKISSNSLL